MNKIVSERNSVIGEIINRIYRVFVWESPKFKNKRYWRGVIRNLAMEEDEYEKKGV